MIGDDSMKNLYQQQLNNLRRLVKL